LAKKSCLTKAAFSLVKGNNDKEVMYMKYSQMTDTEKRKLHVAMYLLQKGAEQLKELHEVFNREEKVEVIIKRQEKEDTLIQAISDIYNLYRLSENEFEKREIENWEREVSDWFESQEFTEDLNNYLNKVQVN
jgi:hypothetical protein